MKAQDLLAKAIRAAVPQVLPSVASAKVLLDTGDADGASNRAYYAMFDAARASLLASGSVVGSEQFDTLQRESAARGRRDVNADIFAAAGQGQGHRPRTRNQDHEPRTTNQEA